jgi:hypothetical protein
MRQWLMNLLGAQHEIDFLREALQQANIESDRLKSEALNMRRLIGALRDVNADLNKRQLEEEP